MKLEYNTCYKVNLTSLIKEFEKLTNSQWIYTHDFMSNTPTPAFIFTCDNYNEWEFEEIDIRTILDKSVVEPLNCAYQLNLKDIVNLLRTNDILPRDNVPLTW